MKSSLFFLQALGFATSGAYAQEVLAEVMMYNSNKCAADANNPNLVSNGVTVFKDVSEIKSENGKIVGACMKSTTIVPGWDTGPQGQYQVWVDEETVPETDSGEKCELILYKDLPSGSGSTGQNICATFYRRIPAGNTCSTVTLEKEFGYAMCCGTDACNFAAKNNPFTGSKKREAKDITAIKTSPLMRRADCKFNPKDGNTETTITYGPQVIVSTTVDCINSADSCKKSITLGGSYTRTNTFGIEVGASASLFEIISASVSFSTEYSESWEKSWSEQQDFDVPAGGRGYVTFQPQLQCSPEGTFADDGCDDKFKGKSGRACFPVMIGDMPDGLFTFVQTN